MKKLKTVIWQSLLTRFCRFCCWIQMYDKIIKSRRTKLYKLFSFPWREMSSTTNIGGNCTLHGHSAIQIQKGIVKEIIGLVEKSKPLPLLSSNLVQTQFISQLAEQTNKGPPPYHKPWSHTLLMATYNFKELNFSRLISSCLKSSLLNSSYQKYHYKQYHIHLSKKRYQCTPNVCI